MANKEPTYTEAQIAEKLAAMPGWYYENGWIRRVYKTDGWQATLMLVNTVGYIAEAAYHHPDLTVTWAKLTVKLQTHSAGGIRSQEHRRLRYVFWNTPAGQRGPGHDLIPPGRVGFLAEGGLDEARGQNVYPY